jgi:DNA-binding MarR family transcriptional regulator
MQTEVSPSDVGHIYLELHQRCHRLVDEAMTASGLSLSRGKLLGQLAEHGPMNQAALAARLGFAARSVTDTVDALQRDGLAARVSDPNDRRAWIVEITPTGRKALSRAMAAKRKTMDRIFGALDAPARAELVALLTALRDSLTPPAGECHVQ